MDCCGSTLVADLLLFRWCVNLKSCDLPNKFLFVCAVWFDRLGVGKDVIFWFRSSWVKGV